MDDKNLSDWLEYKQLVLHEMEENAKRFEKLFSAIAGIRDDVNSLKTKSAIAGGIAGIIGTGIVTTILSAFRRG